MTYRGFHPTPDVPVFPCGAEAIRPSILIPNDHLPDAQEGVAYSARLQIAMGSGGLFSFSDLPAGLSGDSNGTIHGTPTTNGDFTIQATLTYNSFTQTQPVPITILPP